MKKLFFFKSSTSNNRTSNLAPPQSKEKQLLSENTVGDGHSSNQSTPKSRLKKVAHENQTGPRLVKSRSYSSGTIDESGLLTTQNKSPCSSSCNHSPKQSDYSFRGGLSPEKHSRAKWFEDTSVCSTQGEEKFFSIRFAGADNVLSEISSTNASNKVVDRYIDGEQHQDRSSRQINSSTTDPVGQPNDGENRRPRVQYEAPASPNDGGGKTRPRVRYAKQASPNGGCLAQKPRSHSFRDPKKESKLYMSPRDWVENGNAHESPRKLARQVVERLSRFSVSPNVNLKEFESDIPIATEDVYAGSQNCLPPDELPKGNLSSPERNYGLDLSDDDSSRFLDYDEPDEADELMVTRAELESRTRKLEKEKNELQLALEKELDRRSIEWSMKLKKYQIEEHRLRERARELAEQNVSLQKEVSLLKERGSDNQSRIIHSGQQVKDLTSKMEKITEENQNLQQNLSELQEKYRAAEEDRDCFKRNYEDKEKECKELRRVVTRLLRTCNEQEKTIDGLREGLSKEVRNMGLLDNNFDHNQQSILQIEHLRLTGVEQALRKEAESYRLEIDSLRHENINLLHRLKGSSMNGGFSGFKLDQELWSRVHCLQNRGLCLIDDSVQLCSKLLEDIKNRACHSSLETKQGNEASKNGLDSHFIVESDVKLQGFKRGAESLTRSLQTISDVLLEKSSTATADNECSKDVVKSDLEAEALVTRLLKDKMYSKEVDVEQLEAELATAVRGNDILRCEVQNAMDNLSCVTHKMKDLEIQLIKKDEGIYRIQNELQECRKELTFVNGILPKVSEERDMMWEEVKQYSENNMLLSSEVDMLKKKIEALDEDVLLKEGQITILKDALEKPFDLFSNPHEFLLQ